MKTDNILILTNIMPAIIGEAFISPLNEINREINRESSGTELIRNPNFNQDWGSNQPWQSWGPSAAQLPTVQQHLDPVRHNCDKLIVDLLSCDHCREKLRKILIGQQGGGSNTPYANNSSSYGNTSSSYSNFGTSLLGILSDPKWGVVISNVLMAFMFMFVFERFMGR